MMGSVERDEIFPLDAGVGQQIVNDGGDAVEGTDALVANPLRHPQRDRCGPCRRSSGRRRRCRPVPSTTRLRIVSGNTTPCCGGRGRLPGEPGDGAGKEQVVLAVDGALGKTRRAAGVGDRCGGEGVDRARRDGRPPRRRPAAPAHSAPASSGSTLTTRSSFGEPGALRVDLGAQVLGHQVDARAAVAQDVRLLGSREQPVHAHPDGAEALRGQEGDHDVDVVGKTGRDAVPGLDTQRRERGGGAVHRRSSSA